MTIENAFGQLKGRCRCLLKRMDFVLENFPNVVAACVVLHNLCEMYGDHFESEWKLSERCEVEADTTHGISRNECASSIRDALAQYLCND